MLEDRIRKKQKVSRKIQSRWTAELLVDGFTPVSTFFLDAYSRLDEPLTSQEAMFVLHLIRFKWDERNPFPSLETLAERMDTSYNAVRTYARNLQKKGYLRKIRRRTYMEFDLNPLFEALETLRRRSKSEVTVLE